MFLEDQSAKCWWGLKPKGAAPPLNPHITETPQFYIWWGAMLKTYQILGLAPKVGPKPTNVHWAVIL